MSQWHEALIAAACLAPSGDNTQPWRFVIEADTLALEVDPQRDPSPMNVGQRMARIAVGAALETLIQAAQRLGLEIALDADPGPYLARVRRLREPAESGMLDPHFGARVTNRRAYDGRAISVAVLDNLKAQTPDVEGVSTAWVVGAERLKSLGETIGRADALMFGNPSMRTAFLHNVRFDRPPRETVNEGLSLGSLELNASDRLALRVMRRTPDLLLKLGGAPGVFRAKAFQLVTSASGLMVVAAPDETETTDLGVGRAMQRAWLALTAQGLAAQPMMSLPVLDNVRRHGDDRLRQGLGVARISSLLDEFSRRLPELAGQRPAWIFRFGYATPPSGRTGRLARAQVVTVQARSDA